jgi:hypothetical protein
MPKSLEVELTAPQHQELLWQHCPQANTPVRCSPSSRGSPLAWLNAVF